MRVVCTAGHVDHGKSALVRALTGMEPDRFEEERRRGLTIDLGFAWTDLTTADGTSLTVAFVDLPGHERFVANMLAGAGGVDLALFVVAADEGWMPQSQEHLDILDLLGVSSGLVAVTKTDTVDAETIELAVELTREQLAGTSMAAAEIVPVSARTGAGLDTLRERLAALLGAAAAPPDVGRPRLWIDRVFTVTGAGTVVTGTLGGGVLQVGADVTVMPGNRRGRVRGLQRLQQPADAVGPGSRVAVNLSGLGRDDLRRGDALVLPEGWLQVTAFDAEVRALPGHEIGRKGAWHLHAGSAERLVRIAPLHHRPVSPGDVGGGFLRVELDTPVTLTAGDRFVLRELGRRVTRGGGVVLDPDPPTRPRGPSARTTRAEQLRARADVLVAGDRHRLLALHVAERGIANATRTAAAAGLGAQAAADAARGAGLAEVGDSWAHPEALHRWAGATVTALDAHHADHPVERVAPKDVALRALITSGCPAELAEPVLDVLAARGAVVAEGPGIRAPHHTVHLDAGQQQARFALLRLLEASPFAPPRLSEAAQQSGAGNGLVRELEREGAIIRVDTDLAVTDAALRQAHERLYAAATDEGPLTAARAKEVLGTTRKFALPILGELDRRGATRRVGEVREVRPV